jgi:peptide/nickel transport system substrate-binding protein
MGTDGFAAPLPRHLLEAADLANAEGLLQLPFWSEQYVGAGPYRLRELERGSRAVLEANAEYPLGRPRIDRIEIRFFGDVNALAAALLAGDLDLTLGSGIVLEDALKIRDRWPAGALQLNFASWIVAFPQLLTPDPPVVGDVRFRRALLTAIDRQAMADEIQAGLVPVAHSYVSPQEPESAATEAQVVRYDYDPRRAAVLLEELGFQPRPGGGWGTADGQPLHLEVWTHAAPAINPRAFLPVVDYWRRLGLDVDPVVVPAQRTADREYVAKFPAFTVIRYPNGAHDVTRLHSTQTPLPVNRFRGTNYNRYMNPDFDALVDRYAATIPWNERMEALGAIVHRISEQVLLLGLVYDVKPYLVTKRLTNFTPVHNPTWNVQEWSLQTSG